MLHITQLHHEDKNSENIVRSHKFSPTEWVTIILTISWKKEWIVSVIEDHMLEVISAIFWAKEAWETDFSFVSENYNRFIKNIVAEDMDDLSIVFWVIFWEKVILSTVWDAVAFALDIGEDIEIIAQWSHGSYEFQAVSSGKVSPGMTLYIANAQIESILGEDVMIEASHLDDTDWMPSIERIFSRETTETIHITRIQKELKQSPKKEIRKLGKQLDILKNNSDKLWKIIRILIKKSHIQTYMDSLMSKNMQYVFFAIGTILVFGLIYSFTKAVFYAVNTPNIDTKNELLKAQTLIEQSQKLTSNPQAFNKWIHEAETILLSLKEQRIHMSDTESLLARIDAMKKEINDVQTVDLTKSPSLVPFKNEEISPIGCYETDKKIQIIGKNGIISWFARGETTTKILPYQNSESAKAFDFSEDGTAFILTENNRIISAKRNDMKYESVTGQEWWESARNIKSFNWNIYLLSSDGKTLYKHKPGVNGFSNKSIVFENTASWMIEVAIDGGVYSMTKNWQIGRYIAWKPDAPKKIVINKIPGEYDVWSLSPTTLVVKNFLSYIYILSGKKLWIFEPNSKRFQDVTSWNYVAQLELQSNDDIRNICVPRDGLVYTVTNKWLYETSFEIANGKLILR